MNASSSSVPVSVERDLSSTHSSSALDTALDFNSPKAAGSDVVFWCCLAFLVALGGVGLAPQFIDLWDLWTTDALRSIGMLMVPASIVLVLRVWRQRGWELRGTWWGLLPVATAFFAIIFSRNLIFSWGAGPMGVNLIPTVLPIYLYACGVVLLFAGTHVWLKAWFPLALLLFAQPVPHAVVYVLDLPLQSFSAHIARSFATLIGFPPANPELLKLMFTPDFGMFIAPGCDGMRGAVTLGYVALIVGYLKRVSVLRWILYVSGAVLLGHLFNLIRLCALVLYYRIAVGHLSLQQIAKQADYVIGGCLFLVAAVLFLWVVLRKEADQSVAADLSLFPATLAASTGKQQIVYWKIAVFAILALIGAVPGVRAMQFNRQSLAAAVRSGNVTGKELDDRIPKQIGDYRLNRAWQEQSAGITALESGAYTIAASNEIVVGIWLKPSQHSMHTSWMIRGESPEMRATRSFVTARGRSVLFDTAFYSDGITDTLAGNTYCSPSLCRLSSLDNEGGLHLGFTEANDFATRGVRLVPMFFRTERPHTDESKAVIYNEMLAESQSFLSGVDFIDLSRKFQ